MDESKLAKENSKEIVHEILEQVVEDTIPADHQLDGMTEQHEEEVSPAEAVEATSLPSQEQSAAKPSISKEGSAESESSAATDNLDNVYHVKWIGWNSQKVPIVTQNANGPCPMLAIANVLLLRNKMNLPEGCEFVSSEQLLEYLGQ